MNVERTFNGNVSFVSLLMPLVDAEIDRIMEQQSDLKYSDGNANTSTSLENQRSLFYQYLEAKGWDVFDFYVDVESGTTSKRENLQRLIQDAKARKFEDQMFGLYAWIYEQESQRTSTRIKAALSNKAKKGEFKGSVPPYGYRLNSGKLVLAEDDTPNNVERIFRMYLEGKGFDAIARTLTCEGCPTPAQVINKKNAGLGRELLLRKF